MKKFLSLAAAAVFVMLLFGGCKGGGGEGEKTESKTADASGYYIDDSAIPLEIGDRVE